MSRTCSVCRDQLRPLIESALSVGESYASLAKRTGLSEDAIARHAKRHIKPVDAEHFEQQLDVWLGRLNALFVSAAANGDMRAQIEAAKSAMALLNQKQQLADAKREKEAAETDAEGKIPLPALDEVVRLVEQEQAKSAYCLRCGQPLPERNQPVESLPQ